MTVCNDKGERFRARSDRSSAMSNRGQAAETHSCIVKIRDPARDVFKPCHSDLRFFGLSQPTYCYQTDQASE